jgi:hypothetical protein
MTTVTLNGTNYLVPAYGDVGWAAGAGNLSAYLVAIASVTLQPSGGNFTLTAAVNFGATYGITAKSFTTYGGAKVTAQYTQTFVSQTSVTVTHNLGQYPIVQILDGSGNLIGPDTLNHGSTSAFTVTFNPALSGTIIYVG